MTFPKTPCRTKTHVRCGTPDCDWGKDEAEIGNFRKTGFYLTFVFRRRTVCAGPESEASFFAAKHTTLDFAGLTAKGTKWPQAVGRACRSSRCHEGTRSSASATP
jgi:hypothetical protein